MVVVFWLVDGKRVYYRFGVWFAGVGSYCFVGGVGFLFVFRLCGVDRLVIEVGRSVIS